MTHSPKQTPQICYLLAFRLGSKYRVSAQRSRPYVPMDHLAFGSVTSRSDPQVRLMSSTPDKPKPPPLALVL